MLRILIINFYNSDFSDWFQYNKPVKFNWYGQTEKSEELYSFSQDPDFLIDDSCAVVFKGEMRLYGGHWNPRSVAKVDACGISVLPETLPSDWQKHRCAIHNGTMYMNSHWDDVRYFIRFGIIFFSLS